LENLAVKMKSTFAFLALVGSASAACSGDTPCSAKGTCGAFDKCTCFVGYTGEDCSMRTCNHHTSWNVIHQEDIVSKVGATTFDDTAFKSVVHSVTECSSKGDCDRDSGVCKCFDGYTGKGCRRMACNGGSTCSGHGRCRTLGDVSLGEGWTTGTDTVAYTGWDVDMMQQCQCDPGWEGVSCSSRMCPKGDDILTTAGVNEKQFIALGANAGINTVDSTTATDATGKFLITYTDGSGNKWKTWGINAYAPTAIEVEEALEALPNDAIPSVTVTLQISTAGEAVIEVEFSDPANSGPQPALEVEFAGCETDGCGNYYKAAGGSGAKVYAGAAVGTKVLAGAATPSITPVAGTKEFATCSNRGKCDGETGKCECYVGYMGLMCEQQNANI